MGKKKLQGADGINFQMQLTIKGLETVTFPKETLTNESGKDIAWIECLGGKVSAYVNLPHAVRPNNIQPFQLSDCIQIDLISDKVIEYMKVICSFKQTENLWGIQHLISISQSIYTAIMNGCRIIQTKQRPRD